MHGGEQRCQRLLRPLRPQPRGVEDLDALLSKGRYLTGDKVATFKAAIKGLLCQSLKNDTSCLSIVLVSSAHTSRMHARPDTGTICEKCIN